MRVLLDTATFLWICLEPSRLTTRAATLFEDPTNAVFLSAVSAFEIATKFRLGRLRLPVPPRQFASAEREAREIAALPLEEDAALQIDRLPEIHRDPFDRLLIAQAIAHELTILTPDATIGRYPIRVAW